MNRACAAPLWVLVGLGVGCLGRASKGDETSASARGDEDGDGFDAAEDCDDADATVHPGVEDGEIDGVDRDCDGTDGCESVIWVAGGKTPGCAAVGGGGWWASLLAGLAALGLVRARR